MPTFCADTSRANQEAFIGSASPFRFCLLIEYGGTWGKDAFIESTIPETVKKHVLKLYDLDCNVRIQIIQKNPLNKDKKTLFWADTNPHNPLLWQYQFEHYEELLTFDFPQFIENGVPKEFQSVTAPLFFICTNGQHDPCCAKYGATLFNEVHDLYPQIWQTNHLGGDRFAANMLCLPDGIYYRRVDKLSLEAILKAHGSHQLYLPNFAGHSVYPREVQVAEYFIRQQSKLYELFALQLLQSTGSEDEAAVTFIESNKREHHVHVRKQIEEQSAYLSCHADTANRLHKYLLVKYWTTS